jgi:hypothetical protein
VTGPENYREAATILTGESYDYGCPHTGCAHEAAYLARAKVHALLALTAAVVAGARMCPADRAGWQAVITDGET